MEERQNRLSSMVWRRLQPYFCGRLTLRNSMSSNFCHVLKFKGLTIRSEGYRDSPKHRKLATDPAGTGLRGDRQAWHRLVGDHVARLKKPNPI